MQEYTKKGKFQLLAGLYLNYVVHGFGLVILSQNMSTFSKIWGTSLKMVSFIISGIGLGRLVSYIIVGHLVTLIGRKKFLYIGMLSYLIFAAGIISTRNLIQLYLYTLLAGFANSALDIGTYPTLVELSKGSGEKTVLIKIFMSLGEFLLPLIVTFLSDNKLWYGWSFLLMVVLLILNMINLKFVNIFETVEDRIKINLSKINKIKIVPTILLLIYGYTSMGMMIWFTQWITLFAKYYLKTTENIAHVFLSLYSIGSIIGVTLLFKFLQRNIDVHKVLVCLNIVPSCALILILFAKGNPFLASISCIMFGGSAASGVMQLGVVTFMKLYPNHKGLVTSLFYFFGSIASFTVPIITGMLFEKNVFLVFLGLSILSFINLLTLTVLSICRGKKT